MLKCVALAAAVLVPQFASAADLPRVRRHHAPPRAERVVTTPDHVISCTTTDFIIIAVANCGGGVGSLAFSGY